MQTASAGRLPLAYYACPAAAAAGPFSDIQFQDKTMKKDRKTTIVSTSDDVAALERDLRTHKRRQVGQLRLDIKGMDSERQNRLALEINRGYFACGCATATVLGIVGLIAGAAHGWSTHLGADAGWAGAARAAAWALGGFAIGTSLGKLIGKRFAAIRLGRAVGELRQHFGPEELPPEKPTARCAVHGA
ncbi:hypothetical protein DOO74_15395 [Rhodobacteraceae bacterium AsT-22]|nr:hypothetical protein DOO74_15395 [Rhodobacteraceae bacterium AsT-22]